MSRTSEGAHRIVQAKLEAFELAAAELAARAVKAEAEAIVLRNELSVTKQNLTDATDSLEHRERAYGDLWINFWVANHLPTTQVALVFADTFKVPVEEASRRVVAALAGSYYFEKSTRFDRGVFHP